MVGSLGTLATSLAQLVDPRIQVKLGIGTLATSLAQLVDPRIQVKLGIGT